jgi:transcriptional regulator with XRE-family HTH domain
MSAQAILRLLISEYGVALRLPAGDNQIAAHIAQETGLAQGTLLGILNGSTARINENTRKKLADFFNRVAVPPILSVWLSSRAIAEFKAQRTQSGVIPLTMPTDYRSQAAALQNWLCGIHIAYRYSISSIRAMWLARLSTSGTTIPFFNSGCPSSIRQAVTLVRFTSTKVRFCWWDVRRF